MITDNKLRYILVVLISCTALIYFLAAHQDEEELKNFDFNSQERLSGQVEYALFLIVGIGYSSMSIWILIGRTNMIIPLFNNYGWIDIVDWDILACYY